MDEQNKIFVHTQWESLKYLIKEKPKTIILLNENHQMLGFGMDAKYTLRIPLKFTSEFCGIKYILLFDPKFSYMTATMKDKWLLFERLKMALYGRIYLFCTFDAYV